MRSMVFCSCFALLTGCSTMEGWLGLDEDDPAPPEAAQADTSDGQDTTASDTAGEDTAWAGDSVTLAPDIALPEPVSDDCELLPTLTSLEEEYFAPSCTFSSCHDSDNPAGALDLTVGNAYENLVGIAAQEDSGALLVAAGDPDGSYLVNRVEGTSGVFMPPGITEALDPDCRIATLRAWILAGAPAE